MLDVDKFVEIAKQNGMKVEYNKDKGGFMDIDNGINDMLMFYKFCKKREMHWHNDELTFLLDNEDINEFVDLIGYDCFCEGDIYVVLAGYHIGFDLIPFCEYVGIEPELILERED